MASKTWFATLGGPSTGKTELIRKIENCLPSYKTINREAKEILQEGNAFFEYYKKIHINKEYKFFFRYQLLSLPYRYWRSVKCPENCILDTTIYDALVYAKAENSINYLSKSDYSIFFENYKAITHHFLKPRMLIYLKCSNTKKVRLRIKEQGNNIEQQYSDDYINAIFGCYDEVANQIKHETGITVLEYDIEKLSHETICDSIIRELN